MNFMNFMNWSQVMEVKSNLVKEDKRCYFHIEFRSLQRWAAIHLELIGWREQQCHCITSGKWESLWLAEWNCRKERSQLLKRFTENYFKTVAQALATVCHMMLDPGFNQVLSCSLESEMWDDMVKSRLRWSWESLLLTSKRRSHNTAGCENQIVSRLAMLKSCRCTSLSWPKSKRR